jgi:uncharacterized OB-fold protein
MIVASLAGVGVGLVLRSVPWCRIPGTPKVAVSGDFVEWRILGGRCNVCGAAVVEEDSRYCPRCGAKLLAALN